MENPTHTPHTLSIIIPVYNEEKHVPILIKKVHDALSPSLQKEIIIVNDGSTDGSSQAIQNVVAELRPQSKAVFKYIDLAKNVGKGAATKIGILESTGDIVLIQDADLEYSPDDYPSLLEPFTRFDCDAVYGSRFTGQQPHRTLFFWHYVANYMLTVCSNMLTNLNLTDMETGCKLFRGELIRSIAPKLKSKRFGFEPEVTARLAKIPQVKIYEVGISYNGRTYEEGKKIGLKDGFEALYCILRYNLFG